MAKLVATDAAMKVTTDAAMKVTTDAVQVLGGDGYTGDFPAERYLRDAKVTQIFEHQPNSAIGHRPAVDRSVTDRSVTDRPGD